MDTKLLAGDTAIVTGAAGDIGRAIAEALAREGAHVLLTDIAAEKGLAATAVLVQTGAQCAFIAADLTDPEAPKQILDEALRRFGRISILVHCASPNHQAEAVLAVPEEEWERMLAVNVRATYRLGRLIGQHMRDEGIKGRMLFITSLHAETPRTVPHYSVAKAGMAMLMKEMARALAPHGIRVNAIAPGVISAKKWFAGAEAYTRAIAMGRMGKPEEVGGMAVALLADSFGGYVNGTTVIVDGGLSLYNWLPDPNQQDS
jgi:3-oxoacyl-[acyl-carrier protein] reductase